jgi:acyl carrier protein
MMLQERVFKIVSQVMNVPFEEVNERSSPENLETWDSFQHMNLILALEEEFRIRFTDEEIVQLGDAGIILQALQNKGVGA